jgi:hypothetical protein
MTETIASIFPTVDYSAELSVPRTRQRWGTYAGLFHIPLYPHKAIFTMQFQIAVIALVLALAAANHINSVGIRLKQDPPAMKLDASQSCASGTLYYSVEHGAGFSVPMVLYANGTGMTDVSSCCCLSRPCSRCTEEPNCVEGHSRGHHLDLSSCASGGVHRSDYRLEQRHRQGQRSRGSRGLRVLEVLRAERRPLQMRQHLLHPVTRVT